MCGAAVPVPVLESRNRPSGRRTVYNSLRMCVGQRSANARQHLIQLHNGGDAETKRSESEKTRNTAKSDGEGAESCYGAGPKGPQGFGGNQTPPAHSRMALRHT
eukprot:6608038-Prymnesium_polylepis.1